ncbi:MAG: DciA family protein [Woeseiaceae bacterium]|nr:DciA family protein [Woeseiaceae bacterium]
MVERAQAMGALAGTLAAALPADDRQALVAANLRADGELVVIAASPAWAARLRFEAAALLDAARQAGHPAERLTVRVSHDTPNTPT